SAPCPDWSCRTRPAPGRTALPRPRRMRSASCDASDDMPQHIYGECAEAHEDNHGDERSPGEPGQPADAVATGAAAAQPGAEADQQSRGDQPWHRKAGAWRGAAGGQPEPPSEDEAEQESDPPPAFRFLFDRRGDDAADAGDAAERGIE